ncbi:GbsR/MarR family transcriptional regulator [Nonomuraea sp. NPDC050536]|uniref:GbsR/MarR family transcriptional regulator n=1 Tax=Nonomuraea sp. NPDC050536 TaxID=3364366 RepID=UPI0037C63067
MTPEEAEFVDRMGLLMEGFGGSRTMGRMYGRLMICDPPHQSLTELAAALGVSKASTSTAARQLQEGGVIERFPTPDRQHRYRLTPGGWTQVLRAQFAVVAHGLQVLEFGLSVVGDDRADARARLEESRDFLTFVERESNDLIRRWEDYRKEIRG